MPYKIDKFTFEAREHDFEITIIFRDTEGNACVPQVIVPFQKGWRELDNAGYMANIVICRCGSMRWDVIPPEIAEHKNAAAIVAILKTHAVR